MNQAVPGHTTKTTYLPAIAGQGDSSAHMGQKKTYVCPKQGCGLNFLEYAGIKRIGPRGSGLALCPQHNPNIKKEDGNNGSASAVSTPS